MFLQSLVIKVYYIHVKKNSKNPLNLRALNRFPLNLFKPKKYNFFLNSVLQNCRNPHGYL